MFIPMKARSPAFVSSGLEPLDHILDGLRIGDNVVWRVDDLTDYRRFVEPFVSAAVAADRDIIYLRFGSHEPLVQAGPKVRVVKVDALRGFEAFTRHVWQLVETYGRGAFYVSDCLTELLSAWATDHMVGNFFRVICPLLYELDTVAYFALQPRNHSHVTLARIRDTTQVLIDLHRLDNELQVQPVKVWQRNSPTMFLPHRLRQGRFQPVVDSSDATRLQARLEQHHQQDTQQPLLDYWDRLFMQAESAVAEGDSDPALLEQILQVLISRDDTMLALARRYLGLADTLAVRARMLGTGYVGGKTLGVLLARQILLTDESAPWQQRLEPHDSFFVGSDVFYAYLVHNRLWPAVMRQRTADGYLRESAPLREAIMAGDMPGEVREALIRMLDHYGQYPILVRSSSLLEDGFGNAFAGKYDSEFLVNQGDPEQRLAALEEAIKAVYASAFSEDALVYRQQRGLAEHEEPMALLIQRVNGRYQGGTYLPDAAGVGVSRNTFVWDAAMDPAAGMVRLVMGLGTRAVDRIEGDHACVLALDHPHKRPFHSQEERYRYTQHLVDVLNIRDNQLQSMPLPRLIAEAPELPLPWLAEQDRAATTRARELGGAAGPVWRLTFAGLLAETDFVGLMGTLLQTLEAAYAHPVDIEFTLHLDAQGKPNLNLVQCRPLATLGADRPVQLPARVPDRALFFATQGHFMGGNMDLDIEQVIHVDAVCYAALGRSQRYEVARLVGRLNRQLRTQPARVMLVGPGRWGTSSPELGVPVRYADISHMQVLVEVADMGAGLVPDLSFGSHFFQDLVESSTAYVALMPQDAGVSYRPEWLQQCESLDTSALHDDPAVAAAVRWYQVPPGGLRLLAEVVSQRLYCFGVERD
ncbi:MAG: PEP/pyruvate-binding domain-containing protein [Marinobacter sp.]|nr:PEP/pyruvate-binding domain-containing protein [Marinobacter sp.]